MQFFKLYFIVIFPHVSYDNYAIIPKTEWRLNAKIRRSPGLSLFISGFTLNIIKIRKAPLKGYLQVKTWLEIKLNHGEEREKEHGRRGKNLRRDIPWYKISFKNCFKDKIECKSKWVGTCSLKFRRWNDWGSIRFIISEYRITV